MPPQSFAMSSRRAWRLVLPGIAVLAGGIEFLRRGETGPLAYTCLACGLVLTLWFGQPMWRRAPMLWFDDEGLRARVPGFGPLPWDRIERLRLVRAGGKSFLVIDRVSEERRRNPASMLAVALAKKPDAKDLAVPIDDLTAAPDKIFAVVDLAHRHATGRTRVPGSADSG